MANRYGRLTTPLQAAAMRDQIAAVLRHAGRPLTTREVCDRLGEVTIRDRSGCDGTHRAGVLSCEQTGHFALGGWPIVIHVSRRPARPDDIHRHLERLAATGAVLKTRLARFNSVVWTNGDYTDLL